MKLTFYGAARAVTGSCHCLEACGKRILIDCGLQQGRDEIDDNKLPFHPGEVDYVFATHAHIDHTGRIPLLYKMGYTGQVYATRLTAQLMNIMLMDSAHIQESDAQWANQKGKRAGRPMVEPLYTTEHAQLALNSMEIYDYNQPFELCPGINVRFVDAGHLLGSSFIEFTITEDGETRKIVFSGDIGNIQQPIIRDPAYLCEADYVITESTYGDREHREGEGEYTEDLAKILDGTFAKGGNVIIPAFAVGRTQELLYFIREIKERGLVTSVPDFPVYVDSPLAKAATTVFAGDLTGYLDQEAIELVEDGIKMLTFDDLRLTETTEESRGLNDDKMPKVIISASGMCDAGRIRHHLKHNLWRPESTVVFVGYQAEGSLGRRLLDGATEVKLFGEEIAVKAQIVNFPGLSSHAGLSGLLNWIQAFSPKPKQVFVVHGDAEVVPQYVERLDKLGFAVHGPELMEEYVLIENRMIREGHTPVKPKASQEQGATVQFKELQRQGQALLEAIAHNKGGTNKDLRTFASELEALIKKWDR